MDKVTIAYQPLARAIKGIAIDASGLEFNFQVYQFGQGNYAHTDSNAFNHSGNWLVQFFLPELKQLYIFSGPLQIMNFLNCTDTHYS